MKKHPFPKASLSHLAAAVMLVVTATAVAVLIQGYTTTLETSEGVEKAGSFNPVILEAVEGPRLHLRNIGSKPVDVDTIYIYDVHKESLMAVYRMHKPVTLNPRDTAVVRLPIFLTNKVPRWSIVTYDVRGSEGSASSLSGPFNVYRRGFIAMEDNPDPNHFLPSLYSYSPDGISRFYRSLTKHFTATPFPDYDHGDAYFLVVEEGQMKRFRIPAGGGTDLAPAAGAVLPHAGGYQAFYTLTNPHDPSRQNITAHTLFPGEGGPFPTTLLTISPNAMDGICPGETDWEDRTGVGNKVVQAVEDASSRRTYFVTNSYLERSGNAYQTILLGYWDHGTASYRVRHLWVTNYDDPCTHPTSPWLRKPLIILRQQSYNLRVNENWVVLGPAVNYYLPSSVLRLYPGFVAFDKDLNIVNLGILTGFSPFFFPIALEGDAVFIAGGTSTSLYLAKFTLNPSAEPSLEWVYRYDLPEWCPKTYGLDLAEGRLYVLSIPGSSGYFCLHTINADTGEYIRGWKMQVRSDAGVWLNVDNVWWALYARPPLLVLDIPLSPPSGTGQNMVLYLDLEWLGETIDGEELVLRSWSSSRSITLRVMNADITVTRVDVTSSSGFEAYGPGDMDYLHATPASATLTYAVENSVMSHNYYDSEYFDSDLE